MSGPSGVCPSCGEPWIGGPGCTGDVCAWTCGDPDHGQGDCEAQGFKDTAVEWVEAQAVAAALNAVQEANR